MGNQTTEETAKSNSKRGLLYVLWRSVISKSLTPLADYVEGEWDTVVTTWKYAKGICLLFAIVFLALGIYLGYLLKSYRIGPLEGSYKEHYLWS